MNTTVGSCHSERAVHEVNGTAVEGARNLHALMPYSGVEIPRAVNGVERDAANVL